MEVWVEEESEGEPLLRERPGHHQNNATNANRNNAWRMMSAVTFESGDGFPSSIEANVQTTASKSENSAAASSLPPSYNNPINRHAQELDLEKLYKEPGTLEFYCPKCDACIKKVIVCSSTPVEPPIAPYPSPLVEPPLDPYPSPRVEPPVDPYPSPRVEPPVDPPRIEPHVGPFVCERCYGFLIPLVEWLSRCGGTSPPETVPREFDKWDILKSIVYGGLAESIASLSVVTSAASADAATLNIVALALANLVGGLFVLIQNLWELRKDHPGGETTRTDGQLDRYQELLGQKKHFILHAILAILSFLVFGLVPPVVYGFTFIKSDERDYKVAAVAAASLFCVIILALGKAIIQKPPKWQDYLKIVLQYIVIAILASGVSYVAGDLFKELLEKLGWFSSGIAVPMTLAQVSSGSPYWTSY